MQEDTRCSATIRESTDDELKDRIKRLEDELFQHRLKRYTNQLENTNLITQRASRDRALPDDPVARARTAASSSAETAAAGRGEVVMAETQNRRGETEAPRPRAATLIGIVTSDKMQKTVVVHGHRAASRSAQYNKFVTKRVKYKAHDEKNECQGRRPRRDRRVAPDVEGQALARRRSSSSAAREAQ